MCLLTAVKFISYFPLVLSYEAKGRFEATFLLSSGHLARYVAAVAVRKNGIKRPGE